VVIRGIVIRGVVIWGVVIWGVVICGVVIWHVHLVLSSEVTRSHFHLFIENFIHSKETNYKMMPIFMTAGMPDFPASGQSGT
jgi:type IV secretory pathway TrbD component